MGKSEKQRTPTSVRYPYAPVKVSSQQLAKNKIHGEADTGTYAIGHPVFSTGEPRCDMKHLEFLRALGQYYYGKLSTAYNNSCAFLPDSCQSQLRNLEGRVGYISGPLVEGSERVLAKLDCKVDTVYKILHATRSQGNALSDKSSQAGMARIEESVQYLRENGLAGLARHAMQLVMSRDGATETSSMEPQALRDSPHQRDSWSQYAMSPVIKVLESAEPGIKYTQQVYGGAHRAIVSSDTYNTAVDTASEVVQRLQETAIYKASVNRLYPAISGVADPALEKLLNSAYTRALVDHLKPLSKEPNRQPLPALVCATC